MMVVKYKVVLLSSDVVPKVSCPRLLIDLSLLDMQTTVVFFSLY